MSNHTITVFRLEQNGFDFGLDDYPIFDEEYRPILNENILGFYRFYEIGFTNPIEFRERLRQRMNLIMRFKYNELYKARQREFDPLFNVEMHETFSREIAETSNDSSDINATEKQANNTTLNSESENLYENSINSNNKLTGNKTLTSTSEISETISKKSENSQTGSNTEKMENSVTDSINNEVRDNKNITGTSSSGIFPTQSMLEGDLTSGLYADSANNAKSLETTESSSSSNNTHTSNSNNNKTESTTGTEKIEGENSRNDKNASEESTSQTEERAETATGSEHIETSQTQSAENDITQKRTIENEGNRKTVETYKHDTEGSSAGMPFSKAMLQFKKFINEYHLDEQVIAELGDLFMTVY